MKTINVYQSEYDKKIPLRYIGKVQYIGETFGVDELTSNKIYDVVYDKYNTIKIVDDSEEDYIYDLNNPRPTDRSSKGGKFIIIDDPNKILLRILS